MELSKGPFLHPSPRPTARGALCSLLVCVALVIAPCGTARAESGEDNRARAEQLLALGMQKREAGHDGEALELFRQAASLQPDNARVLAHLGVTYQALGRWLSANTYLTQAL